jgi:hypothetical protein
MGWAMRYELSVGGVPVGTVTFATAGPCRRLGVLTPAPAYAARVGPRLTPVADAELTGAPPGAAVRAWRPALGEAELRGARGAADGLTVRELLEVRGPSGGATTFVVASQRDVPAGVPAVVAPRAGAPGTHR